MERRLETAFTGGHVAVLMAAAVFLLRYGITRELRTARNAGMGVIIVGSREMDWPEFVRYDRRRIAACTVVGTFLLTSGTALLALSHFRSKAQ